MNQGGQSSRVELEFVVTDEPNNEVTIAASADGAEAGPLNGSFTVSLTSAATTDTTVTYSVAGTATPGDDYTALSGSVVILAGETSAVIDVTVLDDLLVEGDESVIVTLTGATGDADIALGTTTEATITIIDNDPVVQNEVTIAASADGAEAGPLNGSFTVSLTEVAATDTTVSYTVAGTATPDDDYTALSGSVVILAGETSAVIDVTVLDDLLVEGAESVIVTLTGATGDGNIALGTTTEATITIIDNDPVVQNEVTIAASADGAEAGPLNGSFTVSLTEVAATDTTVSYTVSGTATPDDDYTALSGSVVILAGETSAVIDVTVLDDLLVEGAESVIVTLTGATGDGNIALGTTIDATITISDNDPVVQNEVTIAASADGAEAGPLNGSFTVSLTEAATTDTTVSYSVAGTATPDDDYTALSGSVVILAGETSAVIDVTVLDDLLVEGAESVIVTLTGATGDGNIALGTTTEATITIIDNDPVVQNEVTIAASADGAEAGPLNGSFTVSLTEVAATDTTVSYTVSGTATPDDDYTALSGSVVILAGETSAVIDVTVLDDLLVEGAESVIVTLTGATGDGNIALGTTIDATITISDNDPVVQNEVTIAASADGAEAGPLNGSFTVSLTEVAATDTTVSYTVSGTATPDDDYTALSGSVVILAGETSAVIDVTVLDDLLVEGAESVIVTLTGATGDGNIALGTTIEATITISDNDPVVQNEVTIAASADGAEAGPLNGSFTVSLTEVAATDTTVSYTVSGTATAGDDYTALSGSVVILAGETSAVIDVTVLDDLLVEGAESVIVTLTGATGDGNIALGTTTEATITISDNDPVVQNEVTIAASADGAEAGPLNGSFTVSLTEVAATDTTVSYTVAGTATPDDDYTALSGSVVILAGETSAVIDVTVLDDLLVEGAESVIVTLTGATGDGNIALGTTTEATITISDNDPVVQNEVTIAASADGAEAGPLNGSFTVSLTEVAATDTTVSYTVSGTATADDDYTALSGSVVILAGETSAVIDVTVLDDLLVEGAESVIVTLTGATGDGNIALGTTIDATITISDNDPVVQNEVTIAASADGAEAGPLNGSFTVSLTEVAATDTTVSYTVSGTATPDDDYTALSGSVVILAGETSAVIDVTVLDDLLVEGAESVIVTLTGATGDGNIALGTTIDATITISDNDPVVQNEVTIAASADGAEAGPLNGSFTVSLTSAATTDTTVTYSVAGTATPDDDYTALSGSVVILAGETSAVIDVTVLDDLLVEGAESVIVTLTGATGDGNIALGTTTEATITIIDNDPVVQNEVTIAASADGAEAGPLNGSFTVSLTEVAATDTTVTYSVAGTATPDDDYTALSGSVVIAAGETSAVIDVTVLDDLLVEGAESVIVTLTGATGDGNIALGTTIDATITISDNDPVVQNEVTIAASADGAEAGPLNGSFTVSLTEVAATDTTVSYTVSGTATAGDDYTALSGSVVILAGETSAVIDVTVLDDLLVEGAESVIVTLTGATGDGNIALGTTTEATITISDNDPVVQNEVTIAASADGAEAGPLNGSFTVSLTEVAATDTTVSYTVAGTATPDDDYTALSGSVVILAGETSAVIDVTVLDDLLVEGAESVIVTLTGATGDGNIALGTTIEATITISDNDPVVQNEVTIAASADGAEAGPLNGSFTVSLTEVAATDTTVSYSVAGTATAGDDYTALSGSVVILAGETSAVIDVTVLDDLLVEGAESVIVTLTGATGDGNIALGTTIEATITISDNDPVVQNEVTIAASADGAEAGPLNGSFTVSLTEVAATDTTVSYTVAGTATAGDDYTALSGSVVILAGETSAVIDVTVLDDLLVEGAESVIVTLTGATGDGNIALGTTIDATITISDNDPVVQNEVTIAASADGAEAGPLNGSFTVSLTSAATTDTTVTYSVAGTATPDDDYTALSGSVVILAGETSAVIDVTVLDDVLVEGDESVIVTLTGATGDADIALGTTTEATITIIDNDPVVQNEVTIAASADGAEAGPLNGSFTVSLTEVAATDTTVTYSVAGTATPDDDYTALSGSVVILAGETSAVIDVTVLDDLLVEGAESVIVTLTGATGDGNIALGTTIDATITISDNDPVVQNEVTIAASADGAEAGPLNGSFTVSLTSAATTDTTVTYSVAGTATPDDDYTALSGSVVIAGG